MCRFDMNHWEFSECPEWRKLPHLREQLRPLRLPKTAAFKYVTEVTLERGEADHLNVLRRALWAKKHGKTSSHYLTRF